MLRPAFAHECPILLKLSGPACDHCELSSALKHSKGKRRENYKGVDPIVGVEFRFRFLFFILIILFYFLDPGCGIQVPKRDNA